MLLALPGVAEAKTKTVNLGIPPSVGQGVPEAAGRRRQRLLPARGHDQQGRQGQASCPSASTRSTSRRAAATMLPLISPTGEKVAGANDAAGQPFWFNGQDQVGFTPRARRRARSARSSPTTAASGVASGLPLGREAQAGHGDLQEDRAVHVLLQHPRRHEGHRHGQGQGRDGPVREGRQEGPQAPGRDGA